MELLNQTSTLSVHNSLNPSIHSSHALTLYFDGNCPLCKAEMIYLSARDKAGKLGFVDVRQARALDALDGVSCDSALANIHAQTLDGKTLIGVDVFREAYALVDLKVLSWFLSIKPFQPFFRFGYRLFATHRYSLSKVLGGPALKLVKIITKKDHL